ncbi:transcription factor grauzone-like [Anopheles bellator]|uniref:transcription factor grauzone-like n=1 Tax=Anopheles bellator TaxID=139047 RepID=UPI002647E72F|nr:transcription factor grauzone-like [Anopheles bellator]
MLDSVFGFAFSEHLPTEVCSRCCSKVRDFYNFTQEVQSNQERLERDYLAVRTDPLSDSALKEPTEQHDFCVTVCKGSTFPVEPDKALRNPLSYEANSTTGSDNELPAEPEACCHEHNEPEVRACEGQSEKLHESDRTIQKFFKLCCELCPEDSGKDFGSFSKLTAHYRKTHGTRGYLRCCGKQFSRRFRVMEHIAHHQGAIRCDVCDKSFSSRSYMVVHKQTKHGSGATSPPHRDHRCENCAEAFCSRTQLRVHMFKHETKACPVCKKTFSASYIKKHTTEMHGERQMLICDVCGKQMCTKLAMKRHIMLHAGIGTSEKVQCGYCAKSVQGKHNLKQHIRYMHLEEGQVFRCDICDHKSPNSKALQYHKRRVHVEKNFACEQCGKRFKQKIYLTEHLASHTARRLYSCDICEATFNSKANYYKHRKSRHAAEWKAMKEQQ